MPFFSLLFLTISPLYWWNPCGPPPLPHLSLCLSPNLPLFLPRLPRLHFCRGGNEIFKAVLLLKPIFRLERASPLSLCLSCVCVCVCVCVCWHAPHAAATAALPPSAVSITEQTLCICQTQTLWKINETFRRPKRRSSLSYWSLWILHW